MEQPEPNRFKCWIDGLDLRRSRIEYDQRLLRKGETRDFGRRTMTQTCAGDKVSIMTAVIDEHDFRNRPVCQVMTRNRGHDDSFLFDTGLNCLPPFLSFGQFRPFAEMTEGRAVAESSSRYRVEDPRTLIEFVVHWDEERNTFARVEYTRRGIAEDLLQKVQDRTDLTEADRQRLRTERVLVGRGGYEYGNFEAVAMAGIHFPTKMSRRMQERAYSDLRTYSITRWEVNPDLPPTLFDPGFPPDARVSDSRDADDKK